MRVFQSLLTKTCIVLIGTLCAATITYAQFTTVYNVPPDILPAAIGSNTQVNVFDGGLLDSPRLGGTNASDSNIEFNVFGGHAGFLVVQGDSTINVHNGVVSSIWKVLSAPDALVNVNGGIVHGYLRGGADFKVNLRGGRTSSLIGTTGSAFNIFGSDFQLNGVPVAGLVQPGDSLPLNVPLDSLLTGVLSDGTPFSISTYAYDPMISNPTPLQRIESIPNGSLTLTMSVPSPPPNASIINAPSDPMPLGLRNGQVLNLGAGAEHIPGLFEAAEGSTLNVIGGSLFGVNAVGATVNISSGGGGDIFAYSGSEVSLSGSGRVNRLDVRSSSVADVSGGDAGSEAVVVDGGVLNIRGGAVGSTWVRAGLGGTLNFSGGSTGSLRLFPGSETNWSGGSGGQIFVYADATLNLFGNRFLLDGAPISGLGAAGDSLVLATRGGSVLTGFLADGSPFDLLLDAQFISWDRVDPAATLRLTVVPEPACLLLLAMALGMLAHRVFASPHRIMRGDGVRF